MANWRVGKSKVIMGIPRFPKDHGGFLARLGGMLLAVVRRRIQG